MAMAVQLSTHLGVVDALEFGEAAQPLIIMIQGKSANQDVITEWLPFAKELAASGHCVVLPNLHSNPATKPGTVTSADVQKIVLDIFKRCNTTSAIVFGKSWGGGMAVEFAANYPDLVQSLVLVAPHLGDMSFIARIADKRTLLFWARDDPVKSFELSSQYVGQMSHVELQAVDAGGHRVLSEYLPAMSQFVKGSMPQLLALPAPEDASSSITLNCGTGEAVTLDHLGPVVVNADGTLARITNWAEMTEKEQLLTKRKIAKRNIERLHALREQGELVNEQVVSALMSKQ